MQRNKPTQPCYKSSWVGPSEFWGFIVERLCKTHFTFSSCRVLHSIVAVMIIHCHAVPPILHIESFSDESLLIYKPFQNGLEKLPFILPVDYRGSKLIQRYSGKSSFTLSRTCPEPGNLPSLLEPQQHENAPSGKKVHAHNKQVYVHKKERKKTKT